MDSNRWLSPTLGASPLQTRFKIARLRNEFSELSHTLAATQQNAQRQAEQREQGFRRHAAEYEVAARDICTSELATHDAILRSDFQSQHANTIGRAEACTADIRTQGQEYAEQEAEQARQKTINEAEEALKVNQATLQADMAHMKQQPNCL